MAIPFYNFTPTEGSGRPIQQASNRFLVIGPASAGTKETEIYTFANGASVNSSIGYGNAAVATQLILAEAPSGYQTVDVIVASASNAASVTLVSAASPTIVVGGTPNATYDFRITVTSAGTRGTGFFTYSADGGETTSPAIQIPADGIYTLANTGVSATFATGTHAVGNAAHYITQGPTMNTTDLAACISTLSTSQNSYTGILIANDDPNPANATALFTAMNTHLGTLANTYQKFTQAILPVGGETKLLNRASPSAAVGTYRPTNVLANVTGSATSTGRFIMAVAEKTCVALPNPFTGYANPRLPVAFPAAAAAHGVGANITKNIAKDALPGATKPSYDEFLDGSAYHDYKIAAPRTWRNRPGVFLNQQLIKTDSTSTWNNWYKARLTSRAEEVALAAIEPFINTHVRTLTDGTGRIDPVDQAGIENAVNSALEAALINVTNEQGTQGYCKAVVFSLDPSTNVFQTEALSATLTIVPFANISSVAITINLSNVLPVQAV